MTPPATARIPRWFLLLTLGVCTFWVASSLVGVAVRVGRIEVVACGGSFGARFSVDAEPVAWSSTPDPNRTPAPGDNEFTHFCEDPNSPMVSFLRADAGTAWGLLANGSRRRLCRLSLGPNNQRLVVNALRPPPTAFLAGFHAPGWYSDPSAGIGGVASVSSSTVITVAAVLGVVVYTGRRYARRRAARRRAAAAAES